MEEGSSYLKIGRLVAGPLAAITFLGIWIIATAGFGPYGFVIGGIAGVLFGGFVWRVAAMLWPVAIFGICVIISQVDDLIERSKSSAQAASTAPAISNETSGIAAPEIVETPVKSFLPDASGGQPNPWDEYAPLPSAPPAHDAAPVTAVPVEDGKPWEEYAPLPADKKGEHFGDDELSTNKTD